MWLVVGGLTTIIWSVVGFFTAIGRWSVVFQIGGRWFLWSVVGYFLGKWSVVGVTVVGGLWSVAGRWAVGLYYAVCDKECQRSGRKNWCTNPQ